MTALTRKEILLAGLSIVLTWSVGEVAARLLLSPPLQISKRRFSDPGIPKHLADPQLGWAIAPQNASYRFRASSQAGSVDVCYSIQHGRRATAAHPVAGPLLISAGCSFTFGLGLNDQETWPWLLQERLPAYHVVNTGTNGYGTDQALLAAERVALDSTEPTRMVVLGFGDFQIERNRSTQAMIYYPYPLGKPLFLPRGDTLESAGLVKFWYPGNLLDGSVLFMNITNRVANWVNRVPSHQGAREVTARLIVEFSRRFQARGVRLAVVIVPHAGDQSPQSKIDSQFIVDRLRAAGIPTLIPNFPRLPDGRLDIHRFLIPSDQVHPNREYNLLLADQLAQFLADGQPRASEVPPPSR